MTRDQRIQRKVRRLMGMIHAGEARSALALEVSAEPSLFTPWVRL